MQRNRPPMTDSQSQIEAAREVLATVLWLPEKCDLDRSRKVRAGRQPFRAAGGLKVVGSTDTIEESSAMPAPHPRRRWRFTLASAVSATLLAVVAGCGEPSHAGNVAAAVSATTVASPTPSASASTPTEAAPATAAVSPVPDKPG